VQITLTPNPLTPQCFSLHLVSGRFRHLDVRRLTEGLPMRIKLTSTFCRDAAAEIGKERTIFWDATMPGFGLVVMANGVRSYCIQYKVSGRSRRMGISRNLHLDAARRQARVLLGDVARGLDPLAQKRKAATGGKNTLRAITDEFLAREGKNLRSAAQRRATFERLIFPRLGQRPIADIRRSEIIRLLDAVEDARGPAMSEKVHMALRRLFSWHAARDDEFRSPIVRGMRKTSTTRRSRILSDDELRAVWKATERVGVFGTMVRCLLLTATRRNEVAEMKRAELDGADWVIPGSRYKTKVDHLIPLSKKAQAHLAAIPVLGDAGWVFTADGKRPWLSFTDGKRLLDDASGVTGWTIHDLRRTARSLMSRAGIDANVAERCLGHVIGGIRGVYDRHAYHEEKARAFEMLAAQIERIVDPQPNVTALRTKTAGLRPALVR
jgi:integrase